MPVLSSPDPTVGIACSLPVLEMAFSLDSLQDLVADGLDEVHLHDRQLRIAIDRDATSDLYAKTVAWAEAKKACCSYLGFAVEETPARVVLEIAAPQGAELTLEGFQHLLLAAARAGRQPAGSRTSEAARVL